MRKNILTVLTFVFVSLLTLTGCGSTSNSGETTTVSINAVEMQENQIVVTGKDFTLSLPFTKQLDNTYLVELSDFNLIVSGCTVVPPIVYVPATTLVLAGGLDTQEILNISGSFDQNCTPTGYTFNATQTTTKDGETLSEPISFIYNYSGVIGIGESGYSIINASTPLLVSAENTAYSITLQIAKDGYAAPSENLKLQLFDNTFGITSNSSAVTDDNGIASFGYTSPQPLPADGTTTTLLIDLVDENDTVVLTQEIVLAFNTNSIDTTGLTLTSVPPVVNISTTGEQSAISLYLSNTTGDVIPNVDIKANFFDPNTGTLNAYIATTNNNGQVVFNYTAPATLPADDINITFDVLNPNFSIEEQVEVKFGSSSAAQVDTTNYELIPIPTEFNITTAGDGQVISLYLRDTVTSTPVADVAIKADFFDPNNGTLNTYSAVTNVNGQVVFNYTAPATLPAVGFDITFDVENATASIAQTVAVGFSGTTLPGVDTTNYELIPIPTEFNITTAGDGQVISLYLKDTVTNSPVADVAIKADFFDPNNGTLNTYSAVTNVNGQVVFNYTAPATLPAVGFDITFDVENATASIAQTVAVGFSGTTLPGVDTTNYELIPIPTEFNITTAGDGQVISLYLKDTVTNSPVADVAIKADFFDPNNGTLNTYSAVTNVNGQVVFNYTAPATLPAVGFDITFDVENATASIAQTVAVGFSGTTLPGVDTTNYELIPIPTEFNITTAGDGQVISLYLKDTVTNSPVADVAIKADFFDPNNGTLNTYSAVTNVNGQVVFNYTAPATLPAVGFDITFDVENATASIAQTVAVGFSGTALPGVDTTDMNLWVVPNEINITQTEESRAIDLYLEDNNSNLLLEGVGIEAVFFDPSNGTLSTYTGTTDTNGHVVFNYTAPAILPGTALTITFRVSNGQPVLSSPVTINFIGGQPIDTSSMNLYVTLPTIDAAALVPELKEDIDIYVEDASTQNPIEGIEVRAIFFDPNYGSLDKYTAETDVNGHIVFIYTAPEANPGIDINITFDIVNGSPIKDVNVTLDF